MRRPLLIAVLLLLAAAAGYGLLARDGNQTARPKGRGPVPVLLEAAVRSDLPVQLTVIGRAEAYESVTVRSRIDGQVTAVRFRDGQHVAKGDVLVTIDDADYRAKLAQAEANLARDQAELAKARSELERYINPKTRAYVSELQITQVQSAAEAAEATVRADAAAVTMARLQLEYATVRAPIAGIAGSRLLSPGALVRANDTAVTVVNMVRPIYVTFAVPEASLPALRAALKRGPVKTLVTVASEPDAPMEGVTRFVDNAVDPATGTIQAKAELPNDDERLTPGQFVSVQLTLDTLRDAITVPSAAVQQGPQGSFVYVVDADDTARLRPVEVRLAGATVTALEGVKEGERVVTDGHLRLTPGAKVKLAGAGSAQANGKAPGAPTAPR